MVPKTVLRGTGLLDGSAFTVLRAGYAKGGAAWLAQ